jgi:uncharacterized protein
MRVLMTGATGLIGKETGKRLIESGHEITALVRDPERARKELPFPAKLIKWNAGDVIPSEAFTGVEGVIHLAGEPVADGRWTEERKQKIRDSRVKGTRELVSAILDTKLALKVFVLGSAIGFYGDTGDNAVDENSAPGSGFLADVVRDWEAQVEPLSASSRVAIIRTSVVLSRHGGAMEKLLPMFEKGVAGHLGNGQQWMSWIHLEDIARLFAFALENEKAQGVLNGAAPEPVRNDRFTKELARALEKPVFLPVPEAALKLALGEMSATILASQRVLPKKTEEAGFKFDHPEIVEALTEIATPLRGGQHELFSEQWLPLTPEELFPFYCDEHNLEELTPPFLKFNVVGKSTAEIEEGTLIDYKLSVHGLPFGWRTRIEEWTPNKRFVDTQLKGPYAKWYHVHDFIPFAGGTLVRDRVTYKLPLGFLGDIAAGWKVGGDVKKIFAYRREVIDRRFGQ